jgi:acyl carrier protein
MYVGGAGVARGYLKRPELTAQRFVESQFAGGGRLYRTGDLARRLVNGDLEYLGRIDHQVKIRGFRVELGEIESIISVFSGIREVVVIAREDKPGDKKLVAYFCSTGEVAPDALRAHLRVRLPDYMLPASFVRMDALPLTANGKVDRLALPAPDVTRASREETYAAPRTEMERTVAAIWQELLDNPGISLEANFFDLGGHSLLLVQAHRKLQQVLGRTLPIVTLLQHPTVRSLAQQLAGNGVSRLASDGLNERARRQQEAMARMRTRRKG